MKQKNLNFVQYLQSLDEIPELELHDFEYYLKSNPWLSNLFNLQAHILFLHDYSTKTYRYFSKNVQPVLGYRAEEFLEGGSEFFLHVHNKQDLQVFNEKIFQDNLKFLDHKPVAEHPDYLFIHNFRVKKKDGTYAQLLQQSRYIKSTDKGKPIFSLGTATNISCFKNDTKICHYIDLIRDGCYHETMLANNYFADSEEAKLTRRELEILKYILDGYNSQAIADKLFLSLHTVKTHRKNMLEKSNAKNSADLIRYALEHGFI